MPRPYFLYAVPHSLYSGRARSYLIKAGIPFVEVSSGHESFKADVLPKSKLPTIPVLCTPDDEVIRDGGAIIDHFEAENGGLFEPTSPKQKVLSALFGLIGTDGLLRPAMHYRWGYLEENEAFSHFHFLHSQRVTDTREEKTIYMMGRMKKASQLFGVAPERIDLIESFYEEFLVRLDAHFESNPYLFGWQPSIGDFGLIAPLYAHLGRDPMPASLMKKKAIRVYRWVERMNRADHDASEYFNSAEGYLPNDEIPETLVSVLQLIAQDLVPETIASAAVINTWLAKNNPDPGTPADRFFDMASFTLRGQALESVAQSYRFVMLQKVHSLFESLEQEDQAEVERIFIKCNLQALLEVRLDRKLEWRDNLDVWA